MARYGKAIYRVEESMIKLYSGVMIQGRVTRYCKTGEFREPRKGEYYLSGAIPTAYRAPADLSIKYHIMRPYYGRP